MSGYPSLRRKGQLGRMLLHLVGRSREAAQHPSGHSHQQQSDPPPNAHYYAEMEKFCLRSTCPPKGMWRDTAFLHVLRGMVSPDGRGP